jgi:hypothetical protein
MKLMACVGLIGVVAEEIRRNGVSEEKRRKKSFIEKMAKIAA